MLAALTPQDALIDHLISFVPTQAHNLLVASWAIQHADAGDWQSTTLVNGKVTSVTQVIEQLRLDPWLDQSDPWASID